MSAFRQYLEPNSQDRLNGISERILFHLRHLDLSEYVNLEGQIVKSTGGYGDVYQGEYLIPGQGATKVAIKRLRCSDSAEIKSLFEREVYVWSKLMHVNILPFRGYAFEASGYPLLISDWIHNGSAWNYVKSTPGCDLLRLVTGTARGLRYLHENNIVHSDIKSDNVLVSSSGDALICDFGLSRAFYSSQTFSSFTSLKGTAQYMAYELYVSSDLHPKHSKETDVWAFGMTVYELLTLTRPYQGFPQPRIILSIMQKELPKLPDDWSSTDYPKSDVVDILWRVCQGCWNHDPTRRLSISAIMYMLELDTLEHSTVSEFQVPNGPTNTVSNTEGTLRPSGAPQIARLEPTEEWPVQYSGKIQQVLHVDNLTTIKHSVRGSARPIICLRISNDDKNVALVSAKSKVVYFYEVLTGRKLFELSDTNSSDILALSFNAAGDSLCSGDASGRIKIWSLADHKVSRILKGHNGPIKILSHSESGKLLSCSNGGDGTFRIWEPHTGKQVILEDKQIIIAAAFSSEGLFVAAHLASNNTMIWDLNTKQIVKTIQLGFVLFENTISLSFSYNNTYLYVNGVDGVIRRYDVEQRENFRYLVTSRTEPWSVSSNKKKILFWNQESEEWHFQMSCLTGSVNGVDLSHDGKLIAAYQDDGVVQIIKVSGLWEVSFPGNM